MKYIKKKHLKKLWVAIIVLVGLSFVIGQVAIYALYATY